MKMTAKFKEFGRGEGEVSQATEHKKKSKGNKSKQKEEMFSRRKKDNLTSKMHGPSSKGGKKEDPKLSPAYFAKSEYEMCILSDAKRT